MKSNDKIIKELADKCTNCGNCRIICPVFLRKGTEQFCARGRINLIRGLVVNDLDPSMKMKEHIFTCLDCRQCLKYCPAEVDYVKIMTLAKRKLKAKSRFYSVRDLVISGLFSGSGSDFSFKMLRILQKILTKIKKIKFLKKAVSSLSNFLYVPEFTLIPEKDFFSLKKRHKLFGYRHIRTAIFTGCAGKYLYPGTTDSFVKVLRDSGIEAVIPKDQSCCADPLNYAGLYDRSADSGSGNIKAFNSLVEISFITSLCPNAIKLLKNYGTQNSGPGLRFDVKDYREVLTDSGINLRPAYTTSIIFHSCPKCGNRELSTDFIKKLYHDSVIIPPFTGDYCGSTALIDRSNKKIRYSITDSFCAENKIESYRFIACSSFECVEYLNSYFSDKAIGTMAVHFIDAISTKSEDPVT